MSQNFQLYIKEKDDNIREVKILENVTILF